MTTAQTQVKDDTARLLSEIMEQLAHGSRQVRVAPREYHVFAESCGERYVHISNNDNGSRHVFLDLADWDNLEIDWGGSRLVFHGVVIPFYFTKLTHLTVRNVELDWADDHHVEMVATETIGTVCSFRILNEVRPPIVRETVICSPGVEVDPSRLIQHLMPIDSEGKEPARGEEEIWLREGFRSSRVGDAITIESEAMRHVRPGAMFVLENHFRPAPAIVLDGCHHASLKRVTVRYAIGMAVVAQDCDSVSVSHVHVVPSAGRSISALADGFHFAQCRGAIDVRDCVSESQMDDGVNVHGIYANVRSGAQPGDLHVTVNHHQQLGMVFGHVGDRVRVLRKRGFACVAESRIDTIRRINERLTLIRLEDAAELADEDHIIENVSAYPTVTIVNNRFDHNRARNILVTSPKSVVIQGNFLRSGGAAIKIAGDDRDWYESGLVSDVAIHENTFEDCNYATDAWGKAVIDVFPDLTCPEPGLLYHGRLSVTGNEFRGWNALGLACEMAQELIFEDNTTHGDRPFQIDIDRRTKTRIRGENLKVHEVDER